MTEMYNIDPDDTLKVNNQEDEFNSKIANQDSVIIQSPLNVTETAKERSFKEGLANNSDTDKNSTQQK